MAKKAHKGRCKACGKPIDSDAPAIEICHGHHLGVEDDRPTFQRDVDLGAYGYMHETCFLFMMGDPTAVMGAA